MPRKKRTRLWPLLVLVAAIAFIAALWPVKDDREPERYQLDKTGAGSNVDYTAACTDLQAAVDAVLADHRITVKKVQQFDRQVPRIQAEGDLRWHARQLLIEKPADLSQEALLQALKAALTAHKGKILAVETDEFAGMQAQRVDIGLEERLDGDIVTIIADQLFIRTAAPPQKAAAKAELAIIIDDFGYSAEFIPVFTAIRQPLTFSVLPYRPYSNMAAANALAASHQVMLHMPMEPLRLGELREPVMISSAMNDAQIKEAIDKALASLPGVVGVNNHQGSKATADPRVMRAVMAALKPAKLFFIDSRTSAASVAALAARTAGIRTAENDLFIDNVPEVDAIKTQLRQAIKLALRYGSLIVIGHARPTTATALQAMLAEFEAAGIRLVFASQLVK